MKFNLLISAVVILILSSCSIADNDADQGDSSQEIEIIGAWNWLESIDGWTGRTVFPESAGYTQQLIFSEDGSFSHFRADTLAESGTYTLTKQDDHFILNYEIEGREVSPDQRVIFKANDLVELIYLCMDCPSSIYERIK